jgi:hypothetical protein
MSFFRVAPPHFVMPELGLLMLMGWGVLDVRSLGEWLLWPVGETFDVRCLSGWFRRAFALRGCAGCVFWPVARSSPR